MPHTKLHQCSHCKMFFPLTTPLNENHLKTYLCKQLTRQNERIRLQQQEAVALERTFHIDGHPLEKSLHLNILGEPCMKTTTTGGPYR